MHQHHGPLRLFLKILTLVLLGLAAYVLITYAMARTAASIPAPISPSVASASTVHVATSTVVVAPSIPIGDVIVVNSSLNNSTVQLTKGERFVLQLGDGLNWTLLFKPAGIISRVGTSTISNSQGMYEAMAPGTTVMRATGAPICTAHQACPLFLAVSTITFVVK
jgi:hypothetical protein